MFIISKGVFLRITSDINFVKTENVSAKVNKENTAAAIRMSFSITFLKVLFFWDKMSFS